MHTRKRADATLSPAEAARRLGITVKALRIYERRRLVAPKRTARGWRVYDESDLERLSQALAFKAMGFPLAQIAGLLDAPPGDLAPALAAQDALLRERRQAVEDALAAVRAARRRLGAAALRLVA